MSTTPAKDFPDLTVEYRAPETFDMVSMAQLVDAAVASNPDGLVVSIPDADALGKSIKAAVAAGIPVISMNSGSDVAKSLGVMLHVGQTEYEAGIGGGVKMHNMGVTKAACINQEVGNVALDVRCEGFKKGLGEGTTVDIVPTIDRPDRGQGCGDRLPLLASRHPGDLHPGLRPRDAGARRDRELRSRGQGEGSPPSTSPRASCRRCADGKMEFAIDQQQYMQGYLPVVLLRLYKKFGLMPGADVLTGPGFVTKENASRVIQWSKEGYR